MSGVDTSAVVFTARRYAKRGICRRRVSAGFVLTSASRGPSTIAEFLVNSLQRRSLDVDRQTSKDLTDHDENNSLIATY